MVVPFTRSILPGAMLLGITLSPTFLANAKPTDSPVIRANSNQSQQYPDCYIKLKNQSVQDLSALCGKTTSGKTASGSDRAINMNMDQNRDGMPDELMVEFQKLDAAFKVKPAQARNSQEELANYQRQVRQTIAAANERMPYASSTKIAMREMNQILEQMDTSRSRSSPAQAEKMFDRMAQLHEQVQQDPMYQKVQNHYAQFNQMQHSR